MRELFANSLRMRPDRIIVGEVRGGEALDMVQSMLSGHSGAMSTIHATTALDAMIRLETLSLMSDVQLPVHVARAQAASAIHLVIQVSRFSEDGSRRITRVTEAAGLDQRGEYVLSDLYVARMRGKGADGRLTAELTATGRQPSFAAEPFEQGLDARISLTNALWRQPE